MKPTIWIHLGVVIIYGSNLDAAPHSHNSIQIIWGKGGSQFKLNSVSASGAIIIGSKLEHQLEMDEGWVLLIEPKSKLGTELSSKLAGDSAKLYNIPNYSSEDSPNLNENVALLLAPLFDGLDLSMQHLMANESSVKDKRIRQLLAELNECLHGECIKPSSWKASDVAGKLALSESRFLHLFSEEMEIAWRPYLLWRRMMCAVQAIKNSRTATEAAHLAGFSDSAHLSRTFRRNFGMSIRQALKLF